MEDLWLALHDQPRDLGLNCLRRLVIVTVDMLQLGRNTVQEMALALDLMSRASSRVPHGHTHARMYYASTRVVLGIRRLEDKRALDLGYGIEGHPAFGWRSMFRTLGQTDRGPAKHAHPHAGSADCWNPAFAWRTPGWRPARSLTWPFDSRRGCEQADMQGYFDG